MVTRLKFIISGLVLLVLTSCVQDNSKSILVLTGGHEYDSLNFFRAFESFDDLNYDHLIQPEANEIYGSDSIDKYDVLVYFDLVQEITDDQKSAFIDMLNKGKGIVFLHHSIASYQDWDEFIRILGARYYLAPDLVRGDSLPASTYLDNQEVEVKILDDKHPVTKNLEDFLIHEEVYDFCSVIPEVHPLMSTDHPESNDLLVWTNTYGNSRIVYIQFGHDNNAYSNPNFRKLLRQAIEWVGK